MAKFDREEFLNSAKENGEARPQGMAKINRLEDWLRMIVRKVISILYSPMHYIDLFNNIENITYLHSICSLSTTYNSNIPVSPIYMVFIYLN